MQLAADREGVDVGAFVATAAVAVAQQKLTLVPLDRRRQLAEFVTARVALDRISDNLDQLIEALNSGQPTPELRAVLEQITRAVQRVETAADSVLNRNPVE
ncbi:hypothetical protein GCM10009733_020100 [Nonomuraea maheshkhaliensis]|uniref:Uncharacterized protein n=1 Tax=Nonomuraea maheshkhaliensis TaxID=419590 RepID=A0ABP4QW17_9ACTN